MDECIFCRLVAGQVPHYTVYEDDTHLAFLDIFPHALGHTVVIPKTHHVNFQALNEHEAESLMLVIKKTLAQIESVLHPDGFNVGWNENAAGGQVVPHLHVHIFPRFTGDGGASVHAIIKNPGAITVAELAKKFQN